VFCGHWGLPVVTLVWSVQLSLLLLILPRPFGLDSWIVFSSLFSLVYLRLITIYFVFVYFLVNAMQLSFDSVSLLCIAFVVLFRLFPHKCYGIDFHLRYYFKGQTGLDVSFFKCLDLWQTLAIILLLKQFISTVSSKMLCLALFWGGGEIHDYSTFWTTDILLLLSLLGAGALGDPCTATIYDVLCVTI
jgi:hypothetical protein